MVKRGLGVLYEAVKPRHLAAAFLVLPMLYLLALGPIVAFVQRSVSITKDGKMIDGSGMLSTVKKVYAPVIWVCNRYPSVVKPITWYVSVWSRMIGGAPPPASPPNLTSPPS